MMIFPVVHFLPLYPPHFPTLCLATGLPLVEKYEWAESEHLQRRRFPVSPVIMNQLLALHPLPLPLFHLKSVKIRVATTCT
jgi:hypothetical protein